MILGVVGGAVLAIGSFLNWATVSVNFDKIATALGIDPAQIPESVRAGSTVSVTGWKGGDGKWTFFAGVAVLVFSVLLMTARNARVFGILMIVGGAVGAGIALYDATIQKNNVLDDAGSALAGAGLPGQVRDYLSLTIGIGIWLCIIGGVVAIVAGIMAMISGNAAAPAAEGAGMGSSMPPVDAGFGTSSVAGSMVAPPPPVAPAAAAPVQAPAATTTASSEAAPVPAVPALEPSTPSEQTSPSGPQATDETTSESASEPEATDGTGESPTP